MLTPAVTYLGPTHQPSTGTTIDHDGPSQRRQIASVAAAPSGRNRLRSRHKRAASACRALVATCFVLAACLAGTAQASAPSSLSAGQQLRAGQYLLSPNGRYDLVMQTDGNLVEYNGAGQPLWATNKLGTGNWAVMQSDGNLVVYTASGQPLWSSNTYGFNGSTLVLQDDSNLVIYQAHPIWDRYSGYGGERLQPGWTLTTGQYLLSPNHQYRLLMQSDGNLVEYNSANQPVWATYTFGQGNFAEMQSSDGNFVVYTPSDHPLWNSATRGHAGAYLQLQSDDNLVIYQSATALWDWRSGLLTSPATGSVVVPPGGTGDAYHCGTRGSIQLAGSLWAPSVAGDNNVYSNAYGGHCANGYNIGSDQYGLKYQCTEFAVRWAANALGVNPSLWHEENAQYMFGTAKSIPGLTVIANGQSTPRPGDVMVISAADGVGHVMVVTGADSAGVDFVGQNQTYATGRLALQNGTSVSDASISRWMGQSAHVEGWFR